MLSNNDVLDFKYNGFVIKRNANAWAISDTDYIIPYYAIKEINEIGDNFIIVTLKSQLSSKYSFDKILYSIDGEKQFKIKFNNQYDKNMFINNVNDFIKDEIKGIIFN